MTNTLIPSSVPPDDGKEVSKDPTPEDQLFDEWKGSVSTKKFAWFVGKSAAGIAMAPMILGELTRAGLCITPGSVLEKAIPIMLPAVLGGLLHVGQDMAALKTKWKWM